MKRNHIYSFDVFDTCLCRLCGEPRNLPEVVSLRLQHLVGDECTEFVRQTFCAVRAQSSGRSLYEIYAEVVRQMPLPLSVDKLVQLELDTERDMLSPIKATRDLVESLRTKGDIVFISDMYLPSHFLREQLERHGFFREGDRLYVSDEMGAWKHDGSLFRLVHEREGVGYRHWHHYGDNRHSDYRMPHRLGIKAHLLKYDYLYYERQWRELPAFRCQYPQMLAGISRAVRLQGIAASDGQAAFVADISAPMMVAWMLHVMTDAARRGIKSLYFCSRDMHSYFRVARRMQPLFPTVAIRYLFISRDALYGDSPFRMEYFKQEGLAGQEKVAIVDCVSTGKTIVELNRQLENGGYHKAMAYFVCTGGVTPDAAEVMIATKYLNSQSKTRVSNTGAMMHVYEQMYPLNFHLRVSSYEKHGDIVRPVLKPDLEDNWTVKPSPREAKRANDTMLERYADAMVLMGLVPYHENTLETVVYPTLVDMFSYPRKEYLNFMHDFILWDRPWVNKLWRPYVWKRGSRMYSMPSWMGNAVNALARSAEVRAFANKVISLFWKH